MHAASLKRSPRLRRVLDLLLDGRERTTWEISHHARVCAVNSCIAELRESGFRIDCRQDRETSGERVWLYRLDVGDADTFARLVKYRQMELGLEG